MKRNVVPKFLLSATLLSFCCSVFPSSAQTESKSAVRQNSNNVLLKETFKQDDPEVNEYLQARLQPVRANFKKINSTTRWTAVKEKTLTEAGEGGDARFYFQGRQLQKIVTRQYGETFQQLNEYYLLDGQLSFVLERSYHYNRPIYYDTAAMKANSDTEAFDMAQSAIEENRIYFEKEKLVHLSNNQDCGAPFAADFLQEEQKRIKADFKHLLQIEAE